MKSKCEWNEFYNKNPELSSSKFLGEFYKYLNKGKVLDIASGSGENAIFLAKKGFNLTCVDFSEIALQIAENKKEDLDIEFQKVDLDFYLSPIMAYDSVICIDYKCSQRLLDDLKKGLKVGGTILIENYTYEHLKKNNSDDLTIDNAYKSFELARILRSWSLLYYNEIEDNNVYKVRAIAKKPEY